MIEKPLVIVRSEGEQLAQIAKQHHRILCTFQNRRWDSDFLTVVELLKSGKVRSYLPSLQLPYPASRPVADRAARTAE